MINIGFGPNILLGLILGFGVILLYFLRVVKPEVARDEDIFFATIGLLYSCILMVHGWRLDPILLFSQVLIIYPFFLVLPYLRATLVIEYFPSQQLKEIG